MKAYGKFLMKGTTGKPIEMCGSDSLVILDGRHSLKSHFRTMEERYHKVKLLNVCGFLIYKGVLSLRKAEVIGRKNY
jgi:hypothetical protein